MCVLEIRCCVEPCTQPAVVLVDSFPFLNFLPPLLSLMPCFLLSFFLFLSTHGFFMCIYCAFFSLIPSLPLSPVQVSSPHAVLPYDFLPCIFYSCLFPTSPKVFYSHLMIYFLVLWHINKHIILNIGSAYLRKILLGFFFSLKKLVCFTKHNTFQLHLLFQIGQDLILWMHEIALCVCTLLFFIQLLMGIWSGSVSCAARSSPWMYQPLCAVLTQCHSGMYPSHHRTALFRALEGPPC